MPSDRRVRKALQSVQFLSAISIVNSVHSSFVMGTMCDCVLANACTGRLTELVLPKDRGLGTNACRAS